MRLTKKKWHQLNNHKKDWFEYVPGKYSWTDIVYKLGQLEDIEDELGIDLYHITKAILNGYYWIDIEGNICHFPELDFIRKDTCDESPCRLNHYYWNHTGKYLEDYGKTWALTKKELEK